MRHALTRAGRYFVFRTYVSDRPGGLLRLLELVAAERANIVDVEHHREGMNINLTQTEVQLTVATRDEEHCAQLCDAMESQGYRIERLT